MTETQINVAGMPEFDALLDHIYEYGTASEGIIDRANAFARALLARYGQAPAASAEPVAQIYRKGFQHGSIVWTASGLAADLPDGTELYAAIDAAQAQQDDIKAKLKDPNIVHVNMCRGTIAPITFDMLAHVLGDEAKREWIAAQAQQESDEPLPAPGIHAAVHYAGWLRREAHRHQEPKASVLRQTARMLDVLKAECARLHQELIDSQAQAANADARDAARWRHVERIARKNTAYDRYGDGAHWSVGVFSDDSRQTFGETIDAAMREEGKHA